MYKQVYIFSNVYFIGEKGEIMKAKAHFKKIVSIFVILCFLMPLLVQVCSRVSGDVDILARGIKSSDETLVRAAGGAKGKPTKPGGGGGGGGGTPTYAKVALCIGISNYDGSMYDLKYCDDDARDWAGYLNNKGYTVHTLIDSQATDASIRSEIDWLNSAETSAGDTVVFVYSGHGIKQGGSNIISKNWVYISQSELDSKFSSFASQKIFFFFDACQIGGMTTLGGTGRFVACASSSSTYSYDGTSSMANGVFTYYFLEDGIKQKGYTAMEDAFDYAEYMSERSYPMSCVSSDGYSGLMYL